jgi:hypothetical protein
MSSLLRWAGDTHQPDTGGRRSADLLIVTVHSTHRRLDAPSLAEQRATTRKRHGVPSDLQNPA